MGKSHVEILLIEDNPDDAELIFRIFKKNKSAEYLVHVTNGEEALKYLSSDISKLPKLIIADLNMPLVNGFEFLKKVKSDESTKIIPVVVLTSSQEENDIMKAYSLGVNAFIVKPIDYTEFSEVINQIIRFWLHFNQSPMY